MTNFHILVALELVAISSDTTLMEGHSAVLACVGFGHPNIDVTWYRNGEPVTNSTTMFAFQENVMLQGLSFNRSFLQICSVGMEDAGSYMCVVSDGKVTTNRTTQLTVTRKYFNKI